MKKTIPKEKISEFLCRPAESRLEELLNKIIDNKTNITKDNLIELISFTSFMLEMTHNNYSN